MSITIGPFKPAEHLDLLHDWLTHPRSAAWGMVGATRDQVRSHLETIAASDHAGSWIGLVDQQPRFYLETYDPATLLPPGALDHRSGDLGMHLLVAPPIGEGEHGFTDRVMAAVMRFCLGTHGPDPASGAAAGRGARRVVVEPDVRGTAIRAKNAAAGFRVLGDVDVTDEGATKRAALSVCTRENFAASVLGQGWTGQEDPHAHLSPEVGGAVHRRLLAKAISEFSHERMLHPRELGGGWWELPVPQSAASYRFRAQVLPLEHWLIEEDTLVRCAGEGAGHSEPSHHEPLDVLEFVLAFQSVLGLGDDLLSTYLEELSSTFAAACHTLHAARAGERPTAPELLEAGLQETEAAMTAGHPGFLATNGRIGFSLPDYRAYAPEQGQRVRLIWVAARRDQSHLALGDGLDEQAHLEAALTPAECGAFAERLEDRGLDPAQYHLLPVHPWQAEHRLPITFAAEVARQDLVVLGPGAGEYQAQQSLRTFFDLTREGAPYVKVALGIQNMGFLRGLSPLYMRDTPAINDWVAGVIGQDPTFAGLGFTVLRERSSLGYTGDIHHRTPTSNPYRKMLAALWRENPLPLLAAGERAVTMASLLHRDHEGRSSVGELIRASGVDAGTWVRDYLRAYLRPIVHALLAHDLAFMPHGENLILRLAGHRVVGAFLKDIGEETAVVGPRSLPADIERIRVPIPGTEKAQLVLTDVLDGVLRHLSGILEADGLLRADDFWRAVASVLDEHEQEHPDVARGLADDVDLRAETFAHACLNRLQLRNTLEMVDLSDPAGSTMLAGEMLNPVARATG
ncbi:MULTISPECIES: GNAT family N-acetyltransferase [unclassified Brachybacterium]|uniref:GNAT family N-acetyltransferase n=1 Tax=unclassified Brachybacterium TaxID=2623841 RepID=UPI00361A4CEC